MKNGGATCPHVEGGISVPVFESNIRDSEHASETYIHSDVDTALASAES